MGLGASEAQDGAREDTVGADRTRSRASLARGGRIDKEAGRRLERGRAGDAGMRRGSGSEKRKRGEKITNREVRGRVDA